MKNQIRVVLLLAIGFIICCNDSMFAAELKILGARQYKKMRICSGFKQIGGVKAEYDPPEGQLFLRIEAMIELKEGEKPRGSKDILFSSDGTDYKPLTALDLASGTTSIGHLGFELKKSTGMDLIFLVPESCLKGTLKMAAWEAEVAAEVPRDDKPPTIHEDVKITIGKAGYIKSVPKWEASVSYPHKATATLESPTGKFFVVDVTCEALKEKNLWISKDAGMSASEFSVTLPNFETYSGYGILTDADLDPVKGGKSFEKGKPESMKLLFLVPGDIKTYYLSYRGEKIGKSKAANK